MAKKSKSVVEKITEGVDKILHPEKSTENQETEKAPEVEDKKTSVSDRKSEMGKHKKFDKFKKGES